MKLGFIGTGNMASAIMGGVIKKGIVTPEDIIGADLYAPGRERVKEQFKIEVTADNKEAVRKADVIFLSVKPQFYEENACMVKRSVWQRCKACTLYAEHTGASRGRYDGSLPE